MATDYSELRRLLADTQLPWTAHVPGPVHPSWTDETFTAFGKRVAECWSILAGPSEISSDAYVYAEENAALIVTAVNALPGLLDEVERGREHWSLKLQWELDHLRESDRYQRGRIAQLEAAIPRLVALITCDMGPDCPRPEHWPDCAINVAKDIARAALVEGKEPA